MLWRPPGAAADQSSRADRVSGPRGHARLKRRLQSMLIALWLVFASCTGAGNGGTTAPPSVTSSIPATSQSSGPTSTAATDADPSDPWWSLDDTYGGTCVLEPSSGGEVVECAAIGAWRVDLYEDRIEYIGAVPLVISGRVASQPEVLACTSGSGCSFGTVLSPTPLAAPPLAPVVVEFASISEGAIPSAWVELVCRDRATVLGSIALFGETPDGDAYAVELSHPEADKIGRWFLKAMLGCESSTIETMAATT